MRTGYGHPQDEFQTSSKPNYSIPLFQTQHIDILICEGYSISVLLQKSKNKAYCNRSLLLTRWQVEKSRITS